LAKLLYAGGIHRGIVGDACRLASDCAVKLRPDQGLGAWSDLMTDGTFGEGRFALGRITLSERRAARRHKHDSTEPTEPKHPHLSPSLKYPRSPRLHSDSCPNVPLACE